MTPMYANEKLFARISGLESPGALGRGAITTEDIGDVAADVGDAMAGVAADVGGALLGNGMEIGLQWRIGGPSSPLSATR